MATALGMKKSEVVILGLNLLNYVIDQRKNGRHLMFGSDDKTKDILTEATAGNLPFKLNEG